MSTVPGGDAWRDAGLVDRDEDVVSLVEEAEGREMHAASDEYHPGSPRPDLDDRADEADVAEQSAAVPGAEDDYL